MDESNTTQWPPTAEWVVGPTGTEAREAPPLPDYLTRHYGWAYLWPVSVWFFDLQPVINAILFGHYRPIMRETLRLLDPPRAGRTLQIAGVYGELTPQLAAHIRDLHVIDVAPVQLEAARRKLAAAGRHATLGLMDAERLEYPSASFDTSLMFLLLHEMPAAARRRSLRQALRVLRRGGRFVVAEYGETKQRHVLHRFAPMRWLLTWAEPYLGGFWNEDFDAVLRECAEAEGRTVSLDECADVFGGFYRVARYTVG